MTLTQLIDLVAYLKSQGGDASHAHDEAREQTAGGYRVRLTFLPAAAEGHGDHAEHQHGATAPTSQSKGKGRLVAFIADAAIRSGHPLCAGDGAHRSGGQNPRGP